MRRHILHEMSGVLSFSEIERRPRMYYMLCSIYNSYIWSVKARSHRGDAWGTHGQRIGNLQFWPVGCRSLGVRHHSLLVRRARWTHDVHSSSFAVCVGIFWACSKVCAELDAWMYTPKARQTWAERARPAPDIRGVHALYTHSALATRCAFCVSSLAFPKSWQKLGTRPFPISNARAVRCICVTTSVENAVRAWTIRPAR